MMVVEGTIVIPRNIPASSEKQKTPAESNQNSSPIYLQ